MNRRARRRIGRRNPISIISNVSKSLKDNNMLMINIESNDSVNIASAGTAMTMVNGLGYTNIYNFLQNSTTYGEMSTRFSMFKITSIRLECRPCYYPNSSQNWEYPQFSIAFYPSITNTNLSSSIISGYDKTLVVPTNSTYQSRTFKFFNNYFPGTGGGGYGVWNSTNSISTLPGSIQVGAFQLRTANVGASQICQVRIVFSVIFKDKSLTA